MNVGHKLRHFTETSDHWDLTVIEVYPTCLVYEDRNGEMGAMVIPDQTKWYGVVEEPLPGPFTVYMSENGMTMIQTHGSPWLYPDPEGAKYEVEVTGKRRL